jgi:hypothetical protein
MGRILVESKKRGITLVLGTEEEYDELMENDEVIKKLDILSYKYLSDVCQEIENLNISERQKGMAEIIVIKNLSDAMILALEAMYDKGLLQGINIYE